MHGGQSQTPFRKNSALSRGTAPHLLPGLTSGQGAEGHLTAGIPSQLIFVPTSLSDRVVRWFGKKPGPIL